MSWLDDLSARAEQSLSNATNSVGDYLDSVVSDPAVIEGIAAGGNRTAAEIAAGIPGGPKPVVPAKAAPASLMNAVGASMFSPVAIKSMLPILLLGVAAYFVFAKKGKA